MTAAKFETLVKDRGRWESWLMRLGFPRDVVEDAVSDALLIVWQRRERVMDETAGQYVAVVARNEALRHLRAMSSHAGPELLDRVVADTPDPHEVLERRMAADRIARLLFWMRPDDAEAVLLQAAGHSYDEIARSHGWTYTKVNRAITEGRKALRELVAT